MCQQYGAESKHSAPTEIFACVVVVKTVPQAPSLWQIRCWTLICVRTSLGDSVMGVLSTGCNVGRALRNRVGLLTLSARRLSRTNGCGTVSIPL